MEQTKVNQLIMMIGDKIPQEQIPVLSKRLEEISDDNFQTVLLALSNLKNPTTAILLSFFLTGGRAYIGEVLKTVLMWVAICFVVGVIWWLIDLFFIMDATKKKNVEIINNYLMMIK